MHVGPGIQGRDNFDKYCYFANLVKLSAAQTSLLRDQVAAAQKPDIPYYVCTMRKSHVVPPKHKMVNNSLFFFLSTMNKATSYNFIFSELFKDVY